MREQPSNHCDNCGGILSPSDLICSACHHVVAPLEDTGLSVDIYGVGQLRAHADALVAHVRLEFRGDIKPSEVSDPRGPVRTRIRELVDTDPALRDHDDRDLVLLAVLDELFGVGPLGPLLRDASVQKIYCTSTTPIIAERNGQLRKTALAFKSDEQLQQSITALLPNQSLRVSVRTPPEVKRPTLMVTKGDASN
jgi:hypothetical protein